MKTPEQIARELIATWDEAHINPDERRPHERTHMDDEDIASWMTRAVEADRAQIIEDMAQRAHPDDWGVPCIYVKSYAERLRGEPA